jgi:hypothetical protein
MTQDPSLSGVGPVRGPTPAEGNRQTRSTGGAAFRALLDELQEKTRQLKEDGAALSEPAELAGAVDRARASIDDALSLSDQLLEAYRAAQQRTDGQAEGDQDDRRDS